MSLVLAPDETSYRFDRATAPRPGYVEKALVVAATSTLLMGLPVDWFATRAQHDLLDGNLKMVAAQLGLMLLGFVRIAGNLNDIVRGIKLEATIFLFVGLAMASLFWSADIGETIRMSIVLSAIAFYGLYLVIRFELVEILRLLSVTFTISALCSLAFVFALPVYGLQPDGNWDGVFFHKNALGFAAAVGMPALLAAGRTTPKLRFVFYSAAALHGVLLFFSSSKTMFVAGYGSVALFFFYRLFRGRKTLRGAVMVGMTSSMLFAIAFATANIGMLARWLDKDVTLTGRIPLWEDLFPIAMERFLFGHGYRAAFGGWFSPVHEALNNHQWGVSHAHNALLHLWLDMGMIAVVLFVVSFFRTVKRAIHGVNLVPNAVGLWPLAFLSTAALISISESGITYSDTGWLMYVITVLAVANWFKNQDELLAEALEAAEDAEFQDRQRRDRRPLGDDQPLIPDDFDNLLGVGASGGGGG
jgi:O-antigen ligase